MKKIMSLRLWIDGSFSDIKFLRKLRQLIENTVFDIWIVPQNNENGDDEDESPAYIFGIPRSLLI